MISKALLIGLNLVICGAQELGEDPKVLGILTEVETMRVSGDAVGALKRVEEGISTFGESVALHRVYQNLKIAAGKKGEILETYRKRMADRPNEASAIYLYGRLLEGSELVGHLNSALKADPRFSWARVGLANYLRDGKQFKAAAAEYEILLKDPVVHSVEVYESLAICYYYLDRFEDEEKLLLEAKKSFPASPIPSIVLGTLYRATGRTARAIAELEAVVKRDKGVFKAYEPLIQSYYAAGESRKGEEARGQVKSLYKDGTWKKEELPAYISVSIVFLERHVLTVQEALTADGVEDPLVQIRVHSVGGGVDEKDSSILLKRRGGKYPLIRQWEPGKDGRVYHTYDNIPPLGEIVKMAGEIVEAGK